MKKSTIQRASLKMEANEGDLQADVVLSKGQACSKMMPFLNGGTVIRWDPLDMASALTQEYPLDIVLLDVINCETDFLRMGIFLVVLRTAKWAKGNGGEDQAIIIRQEIVPSMSRWRRHVTHQMSIHHVGFQGDLPLAQDPLPTLNTWRKITTRISPPEDEVAIPIWPASHQVALVRTRIKKKMHVILEDTQTEPVVIEEVVHDIPCLPLEMNKGENLHCRLTAVRGTPLPLGGATNKRRQYPQTETESPEETFQAVPSLPLEVNS
jgi:hypothetical protein